MEISVNELSQIVLTAYDQGRRSVKDNEVKGEILTYRGKPCYDMADVVIAIMKRIGEEETTIESRRNEIIGRLKDIIHDEFLRPLCTPKCASAER